MAGELKNLAGLFANTRTRMIVIITVFLIVVAIVVAYFSLRGRLSTADTSSADVSMVPGGIQSIPGSVSPTPQYAKLQTKQNILIAEKALKKGSSAIPTIVRSEKIENDKIPQDTSKAIGFAGLAQEQQGGLSPKTLAITDIKKNNCDVVSLQKAKDSNVSVAELKEAGCTAKQLKAAGFNVADLRAAGFSACDLKDAGFTATQLYSAGCSPEELKGAGFASGAIEAARAEVQGQKLPAGITAAQLTAANCDTAVLKKAYDAGVTAAALRKITGCSAFALRQAGYSPVQLKEAGFSAQQLKDAGFLADDLKKAGFTAAEMRNAGFTAQQLKNAGYAPEELATAGFSPAEVAAVVSNNVNPNAQLATSTPAIAPPGGAVPAGVVNTPGLQQVMQRHAEELVAQQNQQKINEIASVMQAQAQQLLANWQTPASQAYIEGNKDENNNKAGGKNGARGEGGEGDIEGGAGGTKITIAKAGDIMFAVLNTAINSDEPGPVLATIVGGRYSGARLIGTLSPMSATAGQRPQRVVLNFNRMSLPNKDTTISINAYAIDPNTARTALSSHTDNHYLERYGLLFAASFLQGFGQAVQQSGSTVTQNAFGQTQTSNTDLNTKNKTVVALGYVGQRLGNQTSQLFNRAPTIYVYSGTSLGILFMQDIKIAG